MDVYLKRNKRVRMTGTLFVTFALGVLIGFSMGYAFFVSTNRASGRSAESPAGQHSGQVEVPAPAASRGAALYANAGQLEFDQTVRAGRHMFVAVDGTSLGSDGAVFFKKLAPGGVLLQDASLADETQTAQLVREIKKAVSGAASAWDLPLAAVEPAPGRVDRFSADPPVSASELGQEANAERLRKIGEDFGRACFNRGISVVFAPVLDIYEPGGGQPELEKTCFGASQGIVTKMGLTLADGIMSAGVIPVAKHYPGMGAARVSAGQKVMVIDREVPELAGLMYPFAEAAGRRIPGILVGHIAVPVLEQNASRGPVDTSGQTPDAGSPEREEGGQDATPASLSPTLVRRVLRDLWHFEGVVVAADVAEGALTGGRSPEQAAVEALAAGCDAVIYSNPDPKRIHALCLAIEDATRTGRLALDDLKASAQRLDAWQAWLKEPGTLVEMKEQEPPDVSPPEGQTGGALQAAGPVTDANVPQPPGTVRIEHTVQQGDTLGSLAESCGVAAEDIRQWNKLGDAALVPGTNLVLWVPAGKPPLGPGLDTAGLTRREHAVQPNETLFGIAEEYGVTVLDLLKWNGLTDSNISEGQVLAVYLPVAQEVPPNAGAGAPDASEPALDGMETILHEIQRGESLGTIAGKYHTTQKILLRLNNLSDPNKILYGQKLKVPKQ